MARFAVVALVLLCFFVLWIEIGFGRYAVTFARWVSTRGTVVGFGDAYSDPTIEFRARDGTRRTFSEDYILLCGSPRDMCSVRTFSQGDIVPVVYDPVDPRRAYVRDWALTANVITFVLIAGATLLCILAAVAILRKPPA